MKNKSMKRGITLISLLLAIVILLMLSGLVTYSGYEIINDSKEMKFTKDIVKIEEAAQEYYLVNGSVPVLEDGVSISAEQYIENIYGLKGDEASNALDSEIQMNHDEEAIFYEIDIEKIGISDMYIGLKANATDYYLISNTSLKIYYYPGNNIGNNIYFSSSVVMNKN